MTSAAPILPPEPDRIEINDRIRAVKVHRHYHIFFPYSAAAVDRMRMGISAHWFEPTKCWMMDAHRHESLRRILEDIARIDADPVVRSSGRTIVAAGSEVKTGDLLETAQGPVMVDRLGVVFTGGKGLKGQGLPELVGQQVRYAWHHPATEAEIAAARRAAEPEPDHPEASDFDPAP